jgi:hypothetical protein
MANSIRHNYLTILLPDEWEDASQVIGLGPEQDGFRANVVFSQEKSIPGETAAEFAARQLPELRAALANYRVDREGDARFGPNAGFLREHTFSMDKGEIGQIQFYVTKHGYVFTLTVTNLLHRLNSIREISERIFAQARVGSEMGLLERQGDDEL